MYADISRSHSSVFPLNWEFFSVASSVQITRWDLSVHLLISVEEKRDRLKRNLISQLDLAAALAGTTTVSRNTSWRSISRPGRPATGWAGGAAVATLDKGSRGRHVHFGRLLSMVPENFWHGATSSRNKEDVRRMYSPCLKTPPGISSVEV